MALSVFHTMYQWQSFSFFRFLLCVCDRTSSARVSDSGLFLHRFWLHQRPVAFLLVVSHRKEGKNDYEPIQVVRKDGAIGCRILPAEYAVEYAPASTAVELRVAALSR